MTFDRQLIGTPEAGSRACLERLRNLSRPPEHCQPDQLRAYAVRILLGAVRDLGGPASASTRARYLKTRGFDLNQIIADIEART